MGTPLLLPLLLALPAVQDEPAEDGWRYDDGLRFQSGERSLTLNLRVFLDLVRPSGAGLETADDLRNLRLQGSARLAGDVRARAQLELAGGDTDFKELYFDWEDVGRAGTVRLGQFREPFGLEGNTSLAHASFPERSTPTNAFAPGRNRGVMWKALGAGGGYALGGFAGSSEVFEGSSDERSLTGRALWRSDEWHFGLATTWRDGGSDGLRYRGGLGSNLLPRLLDSGTLDDADALTGALEAAWQRGPLMLQTELFTTSIDVADEGASLAGGYVSAAWFATGETRAYRAGKGGWGGVQPRSPNGAVELAARVSWTDLLDGPVTGDRQTDVGFGVNVHASSNVRVMLHYQHSELAEQDVDVDLLLVRVHVGI